MIKLTQEEKSIIFGSLLGDAHIQKRGNSYRLKFSHGIDQKAYIYWKHEKLLRLCSTTQGPKTSTDKKGFESVTFYTSSGKWLEEIHHLFYKEEVSTVKTAQPKLENQTDSDKKVRYTKRISSELIDILITYFKKDSLLLAVLFMDDGSVRNDAYSGKLATQGFTTKSENILLASYFKECGILTNVVLHHEKKGQYYLSIPAKETGFQALVSLIRSTVKDIPDMAYKLNDVRKPRND